jgi:hypothetical protein
MFPGSGACGAVVDIHASENDRGGLLLSISVTDKEWNAPTSLIQIIIDFCCHSLGYKTR